MRRGGARAGAGRKRNVARAKDLEMLYEPTRKVRTKCREGHPLKGDNIVWKESRGQPFRMCRICFNAYHKEIGRRRHFEARIKKRLLEATEVLMRIVRNPEADPELRQAGLAFGEEVRKRWRRKIS